ncbi:MAG: thioredoxin family protein [Bacteroidales bacterium]|nr:thioredoxin family protein [Bacteroidales bacterium]MBN2697787.1 thioredoxin family protein [Bacteroidales bacterium]
MKGIDRIRKAMRLEEVDYIPWVPFVGCHAASLIGINAIEYLTSGENMVKGVSRAVELYEPDGIPVTFDLQVEAEVLGCQLHWPEDNPPAVISHLLQEGVTLEELKIPGPGDGRIPLIMSAARELKQRHPDIALYGLVTGPFTLALHLLGTDIFTKFFEDPEYILRLMEFTTRVTSFMASQYIEAGCDVIAMVDPMTSQIDPESFKTYVSSFATRVFKEIRDRKALSSFFVCGYAEQNIELMCDCGPDNVSIDENIPLDTVRDIALSRGVSFGGNIKLTVSLLMGTEEDSIRDALNCMDIGGKRGFILAPGCDLPMSTPPENLRAISELVRDEMLQGTWRAREASLTEVEKVDLSAHWSEEKVVIDVVTLDSASCAPCQYMVNAVRKAVEKFGDRAVFREYSIKEKEGVRMMHTLGVMQLPTIVIDGNISFISQIPPVAKIEERIEAILKNKVQP